MSRMLPAPDIMSPEYYPDSDGSPMGETPLHVDNSFRTLGTLHLFYEGNANVFYAANMFVYYVPGDRLRHVSPDIFVRLGVPRVTDPPRRRYLVWDDGPMDCVIELTSESTREQDIDDKMMVYRQIGVREHFLFDPYAEYLNPYLQGYRLVDGEWTPIEPVDSRVPSETLGLHLEGEMDWLRLYDPQTRQWLPTEQEARELVEWRNQQAQQQAERALQEREQARQERENAQRKQEQAEQKAEEERQRREELEQEMQQLRQQLEEAQRRSDPPPDDDSES